MSIWDKKTAGNQTVDEVVAGVKSKLATGNFAGVEVARAALSMESLRDDQLNAVLAAKDSLSLSIESMTKTIKPTSAQIKAATVAGIVAGDVKAFMSRPVALEGKDVITPMGGEYTAERLSMEAYDESANKNAAAYSVAYNVMAARQDEFGEAFFPTITLSPDQVGLNATIRIMTVFEDNKHSTNGALTRFQHKNLLRAYADPTILKNELTRIVPVARAGAEANFVDAAVLAGYTANIEGMSIPTAPLKAGTTVNLLGLSQTDALLQDGMMDITDSIDPSVVLRRVYLKVGADKVSFDTQNLPLATFIQSGQSNYREMHLNFKTESLMMNKNSKQVDGSALVDSAAIVSSDLIVRLSMTVSGTCDLQTGETSVFGNMIRVHSVSNANRELLDLTTGAGKAIVDLFATAEMVGYDLTAYRSNANRRQRGQLVNTNYFTQPYNVMLLSPISALRPVSTDSQNDTSDLAALITATNIRTSNMAVSKLIEAANLLNDFVDSRDGNSEPPRVFGVARDLVIPTYAYEALDVDSVINSVSSHERNADIQAVLVNQIQNMVYNMYRDSQYQAAANAVTGVQSAAPTVIIGTDPVIARYLMITGDLRTMAGEFNVKVVTTLDNRVAGKVFITFGDFSGDNNAQLNPLHFGAMAWKPELTLVMPISRNGQISKELTVSPSFLHIVNLPILGVIEVSGIEDSLSRVPVHMKTLT